VNSSTAGINSSAARRLGNLFNDSLPFVEIKSPRWFLHSSCELFVNNDERTPSRPVSSHGFENAQPAECGSRSSGLLAMIDFPATPKSSQYRKPLSVSLRKIPRFKNVAPGRRRFCSGCSLPPRISPTTFASSTDHFVNVFLHVDSAERRVMRVRSSVHRAGLDFRWSSKRWDRKIGVQTL